MDYSKLSDFAINEAVSMAMLDKAENPNAKYIAINDYCNNPADAWPIIVDNRIGINFVNGVWRAQSMKTGWVEFTHENPLRAAMIVFLMMQEK